MSAEYALPTSQEVAEFYDRMNLLITEFQGGSIHYGYWSSPEDDSTFEQASRRFTEIMTGKLATGPGQRVLDLGCGTGRPAIDVARATGARVVGVSISKRDIEAATALAEAEGMDGQVSFEYADATDLPYPAASFDAILSVECLVHIPDRAKVYREIARVLRPGGRVVATDFGHNSPYIDTEEVKQTLGGALAAFAAAPLASITDYPPLVTGAGLSIDEISDITKHTVYTDLKTLDAMRDYVREHDDVPPELTRMMEAVAPPEGAEWDMNAVNDDSILRYLLVVAHKPASPDPAS